MTEDAVNGRDGSSARAGARTLKLLAAPLNAQILRTLQDGPKAQIDLRRETGHPAQTTLRAQLTKLDRAGMLEKRRCNSFPGVLEYELSEIGHDLLLTLDATERWLGAHPDTPLELGDSPARAAVKALTEAWSTAMLRALAAKPLTLTELDRVIETINYPSIERRLAAMRLAGEVEAREGDGHGTPYGVTRWARRGVGPLLAAASWERRHAPAESLPLTKIDVEAAFLLAAPLLCLPSTVTGSCRLAADLSSASPPSLCGIVTEAEAGRLVACTTRLEGQPDAWMSGSIDAWLLAIVRRDASGLELGGDGALAHALLDGLHSTLCARRADGAGAGTG